MTRWTEAQLVAHLNRNKPRSKRLPKPPDPLPLLLADQCARAGLERPRTEFKFAPPRRFRADCYFEQARLIVEVQGAVHRIKGRFKADRERSQVIATLGLRLLFVAPQQVTDGTALEIVRKALQA